MVDNPVVDQEANVKRIEYVEHCFGRSGLPLAVPGRVLVGEGVMLKMCRKKPKPRQFFLFNDLLVYGNIVLNKKMFNQQRVLCLENVRIVSIPDDDESGLADGFQIISPSKSFTVYAASPNEKLEWMRHLQKCIDLTRRGRETRTLEPSPVWVPDNSASVCMHCGKSQFTIINRRHHCRKCGAVCCADCTDKRWILTHQSTKPVRVCRTCYIRLRNSTSVTSVVSTPAKVSCGDSSNSDEDLPGTNHLPSYETLFYVSGP